MSELKIVTNNQERPLLYWDELTTKEKAEFDYLDTEDKQQEAQFFRYRGWIYSLDGFMRCEAKELSKWHGYASDSYFSGVLIKLSEDGVIAATYYS